MTTRADAETILAIALQAALADGIHSDVERQALAEAASRLGLAGAAAEQATPFTVLAGRLSDDAARRAAYETATAVCRADGEPNTAERAFLAGLAAALGPAADAAAADAAAGDVAGLPALPVAGGDVRTLVLDQSLLAAACELLPDRLANLAILPLQLRLVYTIGKRHGQQLDAAQVRDLAGALGIGAAAQVVESVVRKSLGSLAGSLLGGLLGGATGVAGGAAVTFAATYALGHAAEQYYAQGRRLSTADLKALFGRFQDEGRTIWPTVEGRVRTLAAGGNLRALLRGTPA